MVTALRDGRRSRSTSAASGRGRGARATRRTSSCARSRTPSTAVGRRMPGLRLEARNVIPHGRGLGSSGAAVVSGILAAKGLLEGDRRARRPRRCCALATELEGHPDNVAPALFGGLTIAWIDDGRARSTRSSSCTAASRRSCSCPSTRCRRALARSLQPLSGAARGRRLQRVAVGAAHRGAHPEPRAAARRDRGQAAPELPRAGHARDRPARPRAARRTASRRSSRAPGRASSCSPTRPGAALEAAELVAARRRTPRGRRCMLAVDFKGAYSEGRTRRVPRST